MKSAVHLRDVIDQDLPTFYEQQLDPGALHMAAFTSKDPKDREAFNAHWFKVLSDETIRIRTIVYQSSVAGYVLVHSWFGKPEVSYWIGREFWGRGIATQALAVFLAEAKARPLYARAAKDNIASICVLEKNGFKVFGEDKGFSNARRQDVEEFIFILCEGEN